MPPINSVPFSSVICYSCRFYYVHFYLIPLAKVYHHCEFCHVGVLGVVSMVCHCYRSHFFFPPIVIVILLLWHFPLLAQKKSRMPHKFLHRLVTPEIYVHTETTLCSIFLFPSLPLLIFNFAFYTRVFMHEWIASSKKTSLFCFSDVSHFPFLLRHHYYSSSSITFTFLCLLSTLTTHPLISFSPSFPFHLQNFFLYLSLSIIYFYRHFYRSSNFQMTSLAVILLENNIPL